MDWISGMQKAIDFIEDNITDELDYIEISKQAYVSSFHFQRVFSILCGYTVGEYIRNRRLTLAGAELSHSDVKVIDVALKYGYDTPESFTRAFTRFHGITPSSARQKGVNLKSFSRLSIKLSLEGGNVMNYRIEEKDEMTFIGHKIHCAGSITNFEMRYENDCKHWVDTRPEQEILCDIRIEGENIWYDVYPTFTDEGYDHYISVQTKCDNIPEGLEKLVIPECTYAIFETTRTMYPTRQYVELLRQIVSQWLPSSEYILADKPHLNVIHWFKNPNKEKRYFEVWMPVEKKQFS